MQEIHFPTRDDWREWLSQNHDQSDGLWMVFYKKETGRKCISYDAAVEEALCFGWIDNLIRKLDDQRYARKFTPRKDNSKWSESNKKRVAKLIEANRMTEHGQKTIDIAKKNGMWDKPDRPDISLEMPPEFAEALKNHPKARAYFDSLTPGYQKQFIVWIAIAKREQTKKQRIEKSIASLEKGEKLGMV